MDGTISATSAKFKPNVAAICQLLPDVDRIFIEFYRPNPLYSEDLWFHRVYKAVFTFANGKQLTIPGHILGTFNQVIPDGLSDGKQDYCQDNPFGSDSPSALLKRIRLAHTHMFADARYPYALPPLSATIFLKDNQVKVTYPPSLPSGTVDWLKDQVREALELSRENTYARLCDWVTKATDAPRVIRNSICLKWGCPTLYAVGEWTDLEDMTFEDFLSEYSPDEERHTPEHKRFSGLLTEMAAKEADRILLGVFREAQACNYPEFKTLLARLDLGNESCDSTEILAAIKESQNYGALLSVVEGSWGIWFDDIPLLEMIDASKSPVSTVAPHSR